MLAQSFRFLSRKPKPLSAPPKKILKNAGKVPPSPGADALEYGSVEHCLKSLAQLPRVTLSNLADLPESAAARKRQKLPCRLRPDYQPSLLPSKSKKAVKPFYLDVPKEPYYENFELAKQYVPLSLLQLQRAIDLGMLNRDVPIDLAAICGTCLFQIPVEDGYFGINLTDDGSNTFSAEKINIEVQHIASELAIAAIESRGGRVTNRYFDLNSLNVLKNPESFFKSGLPLPRCGLPPLASMEMYSSAKWRGYLADPEQIRIERFKLAQKYGYEFRELDPAETKHKTQVLYGLEPGWVVNLVDKRIYKPADPETEQLYAA